jgi:hypothetical protein
VFLSCVLQSPNNRSSYEMADFPVHETINAGVLANGNHAVPTDSQQRLGGPIHLERPVKIICIGAGASGLLFAYKIQRHFENFDLKVYEKNCEVSGTWCVDF